MFTHLLVYYVKDNRYINLLPKLVFYNYYLFYTC